jgi:amidohydrolase
MAAATDEFEISVEGSGGHGARPHLGRDPIVAAASLIADLQCMVSRRVAPGEPAVVTVGQISGGSVANVIPDSVRLAGTLRSVRSTTRSELKRWLEEMARGMEAAYEVSASVRFGGGTPPLVNDEDATRCAREAALGVVTPDGLREMTETNMGGEDFAYYLERIPGCFLRVGSRFVEDAVVGAHTRRFLARTEAVFVGAEILARSARGASLATLPIVPVEGTASK